MSKDKAPQEVHQQAVDALFRVAPRIVRSVGCGIAKKESGLTFNQIRAINFLASEKRFLGEIAEDRAVSPASASALVDSLEEAGLVMREPDVIDQRRVKVGLTKEGRKIYDRMGVMSQGILSNLIKDLSEEDCKELARILNQL